MDKELFELCKEVYKRFPEWYDLEAFYVKSFTRKDRYKNAIWELEKYSDYSEHMTKEDFSQSNTIPLYTSDYLLEKLPRYEVTNNGAWITADFYSDKLEGFISASDKSPLKALLKLVIALDNAGELK